LIEIRQRRAFAYLHCNNYPKQRNQREKDKDDDDSMDSDLYEVSSNGEEENSYVEDKESSVDSDSDSESDTEDKTINIAITIDEVVYTMVFDKYYKTLSLL
jgi:hypothetical protein